MTTDKMCDVVAEAAERIARQQATIETLVSALDDVRRYIVQPVRMTPTEATYRIYNYNQLVAKIYAALDIARAK